MTERIWAKQIAEQLHKTLQKISPYYHVEDGKNLPYTHEVIHYDSNDTIKEAKSIPYQTDIIIYETNEAGEWKPRVIVEGKVKKVTTHDAITYSQKAKSHKTIHPYLRYGILIGKREHHPLPGRLFRHGENFDFMLSFKDYLPDTTEWQAFVQLLQEEIKASQLLEEMLFNSRSSKRQKYTLLQRPLIIR